MVHTKNGEGVPDLNYGKKFIILFVYFHSIQNTTIFFLNLYVLSYLKHSIYISRYFFIGSVTFLWLLLSICWSIGRAVGYNFLEGLKVTLPCSYKSTCLLKLRILMTMTTITITITTRQASGLCPLATAESSTTTSTTRLSIPSTSLTGITVPDQLLRLMRIKRARNIWSSRVLSGKIIRR